MGIGALPVASDFVCLAAPLNHETFHLLGARRLAPMKPSGILINVARGAIVNQKALAEALGLGRVADGGLDVLEQEPPDPADPFLARNNVIFKPHLATFTERAMDSARQQTVESVLDVLRGGRPVHVVNPEELGTLK